MQRPVPNQRRHGRELARALSKLGFCSRARARELVMAGKVEVNGVVRRDPNWQINLDRDQLEVQKQAVRRAAKVYLMLNKPRGLVTTVSDEKGRPTVFDCFSGAGLPFVTPVGRLDQASEGLLLFTNDTRWAEHITDPAGRTEKTYHVQIDCRADDNLARRMETGVTCEGELLRAKRATLLRRGTRTSWLEIVLDEGRNRHIRRLLSALEVKVLRLVRIAIGPIRLGDLEKGQFRALTDAEIERLR